MKQQEIKEGARLVRNFAKEIIDAHGPRLPASAEERAAAEDVAKDFSEATGNEAKIESFKCAPIASIGFIPILGMMSFIMLALYYVHPIASLVMGFIALGYACIQIFLYLGWFDKLFPQRESKNVYSVLDGGDKIDYTLVYSGHIDSCWNWNHADSKYPVLNIVKTAYGLACVVILFVMCIIRIALGKDYSHIAFDNAFQWVLYLLPILALPGCYWLSTYLSYDKKKASPGAMDNLTGVGLSMLMAKFYKDNPDRLPKNCRIICAGLGSEEAGLKGSSAFMKAHKDDKDLLINPYFLNLDSFRDYDHFAAVSGDTWLMTHFDKELIDLAVESLKETGVTHGIIKNPVGGCDSTPICKAGFRTVTLCAQNPTQTRYYHTHNDTVDGLDDKTLEKAFEMLIRLSDKIHAKESGAEPTTFEE